MTGVALTLFTLAEFGSASLAGLVAFASFAPGILVSPIAGALLDRHGRVRLIGLDFAGGHGGQRRHRRALARRAAHAGAPRGHRRA